MKSSAREVMRADPIARRRALIAVGVGAVVLIAALLFVARYGDPFHAWLSRHTQALDELRRTDPRAARESIERTLWTFIALIAGLGTVTFGVCIWYGRKWWKAEQWPPAGARLISDRPILRGKPLRSMAVLVWSAGVLVFCATAYVSLRFAWFVLRAF